MGQGKAGPRQPPASTRAALAAARDRSPRFAESAASRRVGTPGRIGGIFRQGWVHVIPGLGAPDEDVGLGAKPARVVERADADADNVRPGRYLDIERRAAIAAEHAGDLVAAVGLRDIALRGAPGDAEPGAGHADRRDIGGAAAALAVAAMAVQREQGFALALVAHRAAQAPAASCCRHRPPPRRDYSRISAVILSTLVRTSPAERSMRPACSSAATSACTRRYWRPRERARAEIDGSG